MKPAAKKQRKTSIAKKIVAMGMMCLLLWITGINFLYLSNDMRSSLVTCTTNANDDDDSGSAYPGSPSGPDEKSPDAPVTVTEEYIHEHHNLVNPMWVNMLFQHKVHEAEKLLVVHTELFSPPPEA